MQFRTLDRGMAMLRSSLRLEGHDLVLSTTVLLAGGLPYFEASMAKGRSYAVAIARTAAVVFCISIEMTLPGRENLELRHPELTHASATQQL